MFGSYLEEARVAMMIVFLYLMQKQTAVFPVYFVLYLNTKYDLCPKFVLF